MGKISETEHAALERLLEDYMKPGAPEDTAMLCGVPVDDIPKYLLLPALRWSISKGIKDREWHSENLRIIRNLRTQ